MAAAAAAVAFSAAAAPFFARSFSFWPRPPLLPSASLAALPSAFMASAFSFAASAASPELSSSFAISRSVLPISLAVAFISALARFRSMV